MFFLMELMLYRKEIRLVEGIQTKNGILKYLNNFAGMSKTFFEYRS